MAAQFLASRDATPMSLLVCPRIPPISLCVLYDQNWRYVAPGRCLCCMLQDCVSLSPANGGPAIREAPFPLAHHMCFTTTTTFLLLQLTR